MSDAKIKNYDSPSKAEQEQAKGYASGDDLAREQLGFDPNSGQFPPIPDMYIPEEGA